MRNNLQPEENKVNGKVISQIEPQIILSSLLCEQNGRIGPTVLYTALYIYSLALIYSLVALMLYSFSISQEKVWVAFSCKI